MMLLPDKPKRNYMFILQLAYTRPKKFALVPADVERLIKKFEAAVENLRDVRCRRALTSTDGSTAALFLETTLDAKKLMSLLSSPGTQMAYRKEDIQNDFGLRQHDKAFILELGPDCETHNSDVAVSGWLQLTRKAPPTIPVDDCSNRHVLDTLDV